MASSPVAASDDLVRAVRADAPDALARRVTSPADANATTVDAEPLIYVAAMAGRWPNVQALIAQGADVNAAAHGDPADTVLAFYSAGQFDKVLWLLQHGADPAYRIAAAPKPDRIGAQPIVENVYWWPVNPLRFPALAQAQQQCQALLAARGLRAPAEPAHLRQLREQRFEKAGGTPPPTVPLADATKTAESRVEQRLRD